MNSKYFYLYKITNLINNKYYYGVHETYDLNDGYMGSGSALKYALKKYNYDNFKKDIIEYFDSSDAMYMRESEIVNPDVVNDMNSYNIVLGGFCGGSYNTGETNAYLGLVVVVDIAGNEYTIMSTDARIKSGELFSKHTGSIEVTNGIRDTAIPGNAIIPYGWAQGRKSRSKNNKFDYLIEMHSDERYVDINYHGVKRHLSKTRNITKNKTRQRMKKITDGIFNRVIPYVDEIPDGWYKGMTTRKRTINDGMKNSSINKDDEIPEGWYKGSYQIKKLKGTIFITNGVENKRILADESISEGWRRGQIRKTEITDGISTLTIDSYDVIPYGWKSTFKGHVEGKMLVNDGKKTKYIDKNECIPDGWMKGSLTELYDSFRNTTLINDGISSTRIKNGEKIPDGWVAGKIPDNIIKIRITDGTSDKKINSDDDIPSGWYKGSSGKGNILITNGNECRRISQKDIMPDGWYKCKMKYINNGDICKAILETDIIPDGWVKGNMIAANGIKIENIEMNIVKWHNINKPIPEGYRVKKSITIRNSNNEVKVIHFEEPIPEGWRKCKALWYNNGIENIMFPKIKPPIGWVKGKIKKEDNNV